MTAYYNEIDSKVAAWLRELIKVKGLWQWPRRCAVDYFHRVFYGIVNK